MAEILPYYVWKHIGKLRQLHQYSTDVGMHHQGTGVGPWNEYRHIDTCIYMSIHIYVYIHTYTYIHIHIHTHIYMYTYYYNYIYNFPQTYIYLSRKYIIQNQKAEDGPIQQNEYLQQVTIWCGKNVRCLPCRHPPSPHAYITNEIQDKKVENKT